MGVIFERNALTSNPPWGNHALTEHGSDWLWAVTAIYVFSLLGVVGLAYVARSGEKIFHYLFTISLFVGSISYFAMASDLGSLPVKVANTLSSPGTRQIFWPKYVNWFVGWTPLVISLGLISGISWATIVYNIALLWTWVAAYLAGAFVATNYKWGFFAFGTFAYFLLAASLFFTGGSAAKRVGVAAHYRVLTGWTIFLWLLYPIAYGVSDGGNKISVTSGFIFFGILDILLIPVIGFATLFLSRQWDYAAMNIYFTQYGRVAQGGTFPEREKTAPVAAPATNDAEQVV